MKRVIFKILKQQPLSKDTIKIVLEGDTSGITASGQFVNIKIDGLYLRRPISICDYDEKSITFVSSAKYP